MSENARRLLALFEGSPDAHGTYSAERATAVAGKVEIKSSAVTVRAPTTEELWDAHLAGKTPLGIIPLRGDDTIVWGCGDIDDYSVNHAEMVAKIKRYDLPLILTKSKSGGAHLFLFLSSPTPPAVVQVWLRHQMARLGYGDAEVFPKQTKILREKGDTGNWIVMPYLGQTQEAIRPNGGAMTTEEFIREAERLRVSPDKLSVDHWHPGKMQVNGHAPEPGKPLWDGPPCLEHLVQAGFPEGTRNKGLFALGIYCRKRWPDEWQVRLEHLNQSAMRPPLSADEVVATCRSLERKDYQYSCQDIPLVNHCNAPLCRTRLHGVGGGDGGTLPTISGLSVLETEPPIWFMDIGEERIELSTAQLMSYREFQVRCTEQLYQVMRTLKQDTWLRMVAKAMETVTRIEVAEDTTNLGQFREVLEEFCTNRTQGSRPEDMFSRRAFLSQEDGRYYFRIQDLQRQVDNSGMKLGRNSIVSRIKDLGGDKKFFNVKGKGINTWWIPQEQVQATPRTDPPSLKPEVM